MELNDEQKEFYSALERTFVTPGWTVLVKGWRAECDALPERAFYNAKTMEEMVEYRQRRELLLELITLADTIEAQKQAIQSPEEPDDTYV